MPNRKFYVVWKGNATGVFDSWEEAELQVSGYPDAQYRSYKTQEEAVEAFRKGYDQDSLISEINKQVAELNKQGHSIVWKPGVGEVKKTDASSQIALELKAVAATLNKADSPIEVASQAKEVSPVKETSPAPKTLAQKAAENNSAVKPYITRSIAVDGACSGNPGPGEYRGVYVETGQELFHFGPIAGATNNIMEFLAIVHGLGFLEKQKLYIPIYTDSISAQAWIRQGICKTQIEETEENAQLFDMIRRAETWLRTHSFRVNIYKWETKIWGEIPADFHRK